MVSRATQSSRSVETFKNYPLYLSTGRSSITLKQGLASYGPCLSLYDPQASSVFFSFLAIKYILQMVFILAVLGLCCCSCGLSLVATSRGSSPIVMLGPTVLASPAAPALGSVRSQECGLSCRKACGIFSDQGLNPCLLHWEVDY